MPRPITRSCRRSSWTPGRKGISPSGRFAKVLYSNRSERCSREREGYRSRLNRSGHARSSSLSAASVPRSPARKRYPGSRPRSAITYSRRNRTPHRNSSSWYWHWGCPCWMPWGISWHSGSWYRYAWRWTFPGSLSRYPRYSWNYLFGSWWSWNGDRYSSLSLSNPYWRKRRSRIVGSKGFGACVSVDWRRNRTSVPSWRQTSLPVTAWSRIPPPHDSPRTWLSRLGLPDKALPVPDDWTIRYPRYRSLRAHRGGRITGLWLLLILCFEYKEFSVRCPATHRISRIM